MRQTLLAPLLALILVASACTEQEVSLKQPSDRSAKPGGTIVVAIPQPGSIEPTNAYEPAAAFVVSTLCDPLIQIDPKSGKLVPAIARSWQVSDSGRRITVRLRRGVRFHNGEEVTAQDVRYALSRVARQDYGSLMADLLEPVVGFEEIHGDIELEGETFQEELQGITVVEKYAIEINLKDSHAEFVRVLAHPISSPIPAIEAERDPEGFAAKPICAGPYRMTAPWRPGEKQITVERFDDYYGMNAAYTRGGKGYADRIRFQILDEAAAFQEFSAGNVQVARVSEQSLESLPSDKAVTAPGSHLEYIGLPTRVAPFDDPAVRTALSMALDRSEIVNRVYGGFRTPARSFVPPALIGVHREDACTSIASPAVVGDAKELLNDAGIDPVQMQVTLRFNNEFRNLALAEEVARQWQDRLGIKVAIESMTWDSYIAMGQGQSGFDSPFRMSWSPRYHSADAVLGPLFSSENIGVTNLSRFRDPVYDRALTRVARRATAEDDRREAYQQLENMICDEMPVIPVAFTQRTRLIEKDVLGSATGQFLDLASGEPHLRELYVRSP